MRQHICTILRMHRRWALLLLFLTICFNLGYAGMVRFYPGTGVGGLHDAFFYYKMSFFVYDDVPAPLRFRPLIPSLAGLLTEAVFIETLPILSAEPRDPHTVGLFAVNSLLVALTTLVIMEIGARFHLPLRISLLAAFVYLTSYPVINAYLVGLVDAGEACILAVLTLALLDRRWWLLPLLVAIGAAVKETTVVFAGVLLLCWWLLSRSELPPVEAQRLRRWGGIAMALGLVNLLIIRLVIGGAGYEEHGLSLARLLAIPDAVQPLFLGKSLFYALMVLLPLSILSIHRIPRVYCLASIAMGMMAILLGLYADINGNVIRPLFNILGPLFVLASALSLDALFQTDHDGRPGATERDRA